jgi:hypothetical protein
MFQKHKQKKNDDDNYKNVILVKKMFLVKTIGENYKPRTNAVL